jgi:hypothetical protein
LSAINSAAFVPNSKSQSSAILRSGQFDIDRGYVNMEETLAQLERDTLNKVSSLNHDIDVAEIKSSIYTAELQASNGYFAKAVSVLDKVGKVMAVANIYSGSQHAYDQVLEKTGDKGLAKEAAFYETIVGTTDEIASGITSMAVGTGFTAGTTALALKLGAAGSLAGPLGTVAGLVAGVAVGFVYAAYSENIKESVWRPMINPERLGGNSSEVDLSTKIRLESKWNPTFRWKM